MKNEVIIIGGGLGGLVCGALLSKEGYRVTVLEKNSVAGGGLHMFRRDGVDFETGIHMISGFEEQGVLRKLCSYLGIMDQLRIRPTDTDCFDLFHVESHGTKYRLPMGKRPFTESLIHHFPTEETNIRHYMDRLYKICDSIALFNLQMPSDSLYQQTEIMGQSVGAFIDAATQDPRLRSLLSWNNSLYAGERDQTPAFVSALISKFYIEGSSRFVGGSQQLADLLVGIITRAGGEVLTKSGVSRLEVSDKRVVRAVTDDGRSYQGGYFLSSVHTSTLLSMIEPNALQRSYRERIDAIPNSYSAFSLYIILKPNSLPYLNYNYFYQPDDEMTWRYADYTCESWPHGLMFITPPETFDDRYAKKMIVNCVMNFDTVKPWEHTKSGRRGEEYRRFVDHCKEKVLRQMERVIPDFRDAVDKVYASSPLTIRDYLGSKEGAMYGTKRNCNLLAASHISIRTKLDNLLLTGQNISLHGILGVPLTAISTCGELVGLDYLLEKINRGDLSTVHQPSAPYR